MVSQTTNPRPAGDWSAVADRDRETDGILLVAPPDWSDRIVERLEATRSAARINVATSVDRGQKLLAERTVDCVIATQWGAIGGSWSTLLRTVREQAPFLPFVLISRNEHITIDAITLSDWISAIIHRDDVLVGNELTRTIDLAIERSNRRRIRARVEELGSPITDCIARLPLAESVADVEGSITRILAETPLYDRVWIGSYDRERHRIGVRKAAGMLPIDGALSIEWRLIEEIRWAIFSNESRLIPENPIADSIIVPMGVDDPYNRVLVVTVSKGTPIGSTEREVLEGVAAAGARMIDVLRRHKKSVKRSRLYEGLTWLMTATDVGIIIADSSGRVRVANRAADRLCGRVDGGSTEQYVWEVLGVCEPVTFGDHWRDLERTQPVRYMTCTRDPSGRERPVDVIGARIKPVPLVTAFETLDGIVRAPVHLEREDSVAIYVLIDDSLPVGGVVDSSDLLASELGQWIDDLEEALTGDESESYTQIHASIARLKSIIDRDVADDSPAFSVKETEEVSLEAVATRAWRSVSRGNGELYLGRGGVIDADGALLQRLFEHAFRDALLRGEDSVTVRVDRVDDGFVIVDDGMADDIDPSVTKDNARDEPADSDIGATIVERIAGAHGWSYRRRESRFGGVRIEIFDVAWIDIDA